MATTARLRIDFQVRELLPDGCDQTEARYITFGDECDLGAIKDFFERCGHATDLMFQGKHGAKVIKFSSVPINKIAAIKAVRQLTCLGLKEAKDIVEQPVGSPLVLFKDGREADACLEVFRANNVKEAVSEACNFDAMCANNVAKYDRPRST